MAKGKYQKWLSAESLEQITNWAALGCTDAELAHNMGISRNTFYRWYNEIGDISDAIKAGRAMSRTAIENMLFKVAMGEVYEETTVTEQEGVVKDGKLYNGKQQVRKTKRKMPPNSGAIMFYLKNKCGYRSEPKITTEDTLQLVEAMSNVFVKVREASDANRADA